MAARFVWNRNPMDFIGHLENVSKNRTLEIAKTVYDGIVSRTPVRTGQARASWRASLGQPDLTKVFHSNPNAPLSAPSFPLTTMPLYGKVFISNTHKYIMMLEYGWSKQAPVGMVRTTLASLGIGLSVRI